ncbi:MAG TPA: beta-galactosidase [Armatimonadota bacterium]|jgi:hypothetical protein
MKSLQTISFSVGRTTLRLLAVLVFTLLASVMAYAGAKATEVPFVTLSVPSDPAAWSSTASSGQAPTLTLGEMGTGVRLAFERTDTDRRVILKLKKPVIMPANARRVGLWLYTASRFWPEYLAMRFLLRDAEGIGYSYAQYGSSSIPGAWNYIECPRLRGGELGRLDETMILVEGGLQHHLPVAPLRFEGVEFLVGKSNQYLPKAQQIELGEVCADAIVRENSTQYWQCDLGQRYLFGEMPFAHHPFVTAGDLLQAKGDYTIVWQARSSYFGGPVAQGQWTLSQYDAGVAARIQRLDMPLTARGQYWVTFKIKEARQPLRTVETRVKVIRGSEAQPPVLRPDVRPLGTLLVLNPQREENIYAPGEVTTCVVRAWRPVGAALAAAVIKLKRSRYPSGDIGSEESYPVVWQGTAAYQDVTIPLPLTAEMPMQQLAVRLMAENTELYRLTALVGQQSLPTVTPWTKREQVLRYADLFENGHHLLSCGEWGPRYTENTDMAKFEAWLVDVQKQNVNTIELFPKWGEIEPMPGVYWWEQLDARMDVIAKHGMHAMINLDSSYVPTWMLEESQADEEGMVNGLWRGGAGNDVLKSPSSAVLYREYGAYLTQLALRYRNNPTLAAYSSLSIFFDHIWADHPWQGQYVDYSESAKFGFRAYLRDVRGFTLDDLNTRWKKTYQSWNEVPLPRTDLFLGLATIDRPDPRPEWRDFLDFRQWSQESYFTKLVDGTIRRYDDLRPVGTHGVQADPQLYKDHKMFVCAGGSEGSLEGYRTPFPYPKRSESILMSFYTPYYTAMSMTNLLAQGNLNVQHFWTPGWRWEDSGDERRKTGTQSLAGWLALFQGDLGTATPIHATGTGPKPLLGLLYSQASIRYGVRSFHWFRLDDYKMPADRACLVSHQLLQDDATAEELAALPCVIIDPTARIIPQDMMERLVAYVKHGGKLVLAPTSGMYTTDPADGDHALRRLLGLPAPTVKWTMSPEYRQPGVYTPYRPWEITGKGTPGEQSLGEPGQTALGTPVDASVFAADRKLVFRLGPYSMYNRDTWGDWSHMLPYFIYGRYHAKSVAGGKTVANWSDGGPAATLFPVGQGQVLCLWGTPDWYNWREALTDIAKWAAPQTVTPTTTAPQPYALSPADFKGFMMKNGGTLWAVARNECTGWTGVYGDAEKQKTAPRTRGAMTLAQLSAAKYRVRDLTPLLSQGYDQVLTRDQLATTGIPLDLLLSESRIFRLDPVE